MFKNITVYWLIFYTIKMMIINNANKEKQSNEKAKYTISIVCKQKRTKRKHEQMKIASQTVHLFFNVDIITVVICVIQNKNFKYL